MAEPDGRRLPSFPWSTYRLQLGADLDFEGAARLLPYLRALGISHLYLSPILRSRQASEHGYDVVDPGHLDPELGGPEGFQALAELARRERMGVLVDLVPNHMAAAVENPWWRDLLEHGPASRYADFFDIDWHPEGMAEPRLLVGVLGQPYAEALEEGTFSLETDSEGVWVRYADRRFPLEPGSWPELLRVGASAPGRKEADMPGNGVLPEEAARLLAAAERLPPFRQGPGATAEREAGAAAVRERLRALRASDGGRAWLARRLEAFADPNSGGVDRLDALLSRQPYSLVHWQLTIEEGNYRRFFDIGDMAALQVERPAVFEATHERVLELVSEGAVHGLRVDHVDGLWDPLAYLRRLQDRIGEALEEADTAEACDGRPFYVVVEKILAPHEALPSDWPVQGTTGYDFLARVQGVLADPTGFGLLEATYRRFTGRDETFPELVYGAKHHVMDELFAAEVRSLTRQLLGLARRDRYGRDLPEGELEAALREVTACLPVYRTYVRESVVSERDRALVEHAVAAAEAAMADSDGRALAFLRRVLLLEDPPEVEAARWLRLVMRWQQVTGPVTAKGLEDTAFYRYNALLALCEVGSHPDQLPSLQEFHRYNRSRAERWPMSLSATSTHDTKRSEDVRARLLALTEIAGEWEEALATWSERNACHRIRVEGRDVPAPSEEVDLYQTLLGAWPLEAERPEPEFRNRLRGYLEKALREAKAHTSWHDPDDAYEGAVRAFLDAVLDDQGFLDAFSPLCGRLARLGAANSLSQTLLALLSPGVPDRYQGTELWEFRLVDPDNRRPVDFERRRALLDELDRAAAADRVGLAERLMESWRDGRVKLWLTAEALRLRRRHSDLFARGGYMPLTVEGERAEHLCGFARRHADGWVLAVVPRLTAALGCGDRLAALTTASWGSTRIRLPDGAPRRWQEVYTDRKIRAAGEGDAVGRLEPSVLFAHLPFALLVGGDPFRVRRAR